MQEIEGKLEAFEEGERFLKHGRLLDVDGPFVQEAMQVLRVGLCGEATVECFQRKLLSIGVSVSKDQTLTLVNQLKRAGLVTFGSTVRGGLLIRAI